MIFYWSTFEHTDTNRVYPTTLCQRGESLDFFWYYLHTGKDGRKRKIIRRKKMNNLHLLPLLVNQKHLEFFFKNVVLLFTWIFIYYTKRRNTFKRKHWRMVQNGNTQIHHWYPQTFTTLIHLSDLPHMYSKSKRVGKCNMTWPKFELTWYIFTMSFKYSNI